MAIKTDVRNKRYYLPLIVYDRYNSGPWLPFRSQNYDTGDYDLITGYRGPRQFIDSNGNLLQRSVKSRKRKDYSVPLPREEEFSTAGLLKAFHACYRKSVRTSVAGNCYFIMDPPYKYPGGVYTVRLGSTSGLECPSLALISQTAPSDSWLSAEEQMLVSQKLLANIKAPDFDLGVTLAELPETFEELHGLLKTLRNSAKQRRTREMVKHLWDVARKDKSFRMPKSINKMEKRLANDAKLAASFSDHLAANWLRYRYAITPLLGTIEDSLRLVVQQLGKPVPKPTRVSVKAVLLDTNTAGLEGRTAVSLAPYPPMWVEGFCSRQERVVARAGCYVKLPGRTLGDALGLKPFDLARIAWEKTPFSFAVDWFLDVGGWLDSLRPGNFQMLVAWLSKEVIVHATGNPTRAGQGTYPASQPGETYTIIGAEEATFSYHTQDRREVTEGTLKENRVFPVRSPSTRFGLKQKADCVALLSQVVKLLT